MISKNTVESPLDAACWPCVPNKKERYDHGIVFPVGRKKKRGGLGGKVGKKRFLGMGIWESLTQEN